MLAVINLAVRFLRNDRHEPSRSGPAKVLALGVAALPVVKRASSASTRRTTRLDKALAGVSVALGVAELSQPQRLANLVGIRPTSQTVNFTRACGAREIAEGAAIMASPRPVFGLWSRVAGDAMDLGVLGRSMADKSNQRGRLAAATAVVAGITALDVVASMRANGTH